MSDRETHSILKENIGPDISATGKYVLSGLYVWPIEYATNAYWNLGVACTQKFSSKWTIPSNYSIYEYHDNLLRSNEYLIIFPKYIIYKDRAISGFISNLRKLE